MIDSWYLHLRAERKSAETIRTYLELAGLRLDDMSPANREATVTGKGDKQRTVRFTYDTARTVDRYLRERAKHPLARVSALWLGVCGGPMTASGVYQMIERRGKGGRR
jgi:integrase/recombinase XerD